MADDISGQLGELCQQAFNEGDYDPAEDLVRDPFCRKVNEVCGVALNEIASMRESATKMHRRAQEAEALLPQWRQIAGLTYVKGSLGRALLAWGMTKAREENDALRARLKEIEDVALKLAEQTQIIVDLRASEAQALADADALANRILAHREYAQYRPRAAGEEMQWEAAWDKACADSADALSRAASRRAKKEASDAH